MISPRGRAVVRERLALAPRLVGLVALIALAAWTFSHSYQQPGPDEQHPPLVVKAQPAPKEPVSAGPQPSPSLLTPEPLNPAPMVERPASTVITLRPPYEVVDVRTIRASGRTITLAGIEGFAQSATCRARDGTRWSCAKLARDALRSRIGSQSLRCSTEGQASAAMFVATCTTLSGEDLARTLVAEGWARARRRPLAIWVRDESSRGTRARAVGLAHRRTGQGSVMEVFTAYSV